MTNIMSTLEFLKDIGGDDNLSESPKQWQDIKVKKTPAKIKQAKPQVAPKNSAGDIPPQHNLTLINETDSPPNSSQPSNERLRSYSQDYQSAYDLAEQVQTLQDLETAMNSYKGCALKSAAMHTVFSDGCPDASIMVIGEAPGADEDRQGKPFVGLSGQLLDRILATINLSRTENLYISNIIPWRPPGNRPPTPEEINLCLPFIEKHISLIKPRLIISAGGISAKTLLKTKDGITKLRGQFFDYQNSFMEQSCKLYAIFHPAYLLRSPAQKKYVWQDLLTIQAALKDFS